MEAGIVRCTSCGRALRIKVEHRGRLRCPKCKAVVTATLAETKPRRDAGTQLIVAPPRERGDVIVVDQPKAPRNRRQVRSAQWVSSLWGVAAIATITGAAWMLEEPRSSARHAAPENGDSVISEMSEVAELDIVASREEATTHPVQQVVAPPGATTPWQSNFNEVRAGDLPDGWEGDPWVGMQHGEFGSWLSSVQNGAWKVKVPNLQLGEKFELSFWLKTDEWLRPLRWKAKLVGNGGPDLEFGSVGNVFVGEIVGKKPSNWKIQRVRLVRDGDSFWLITGTDLWVTGRISGLSDFSEFIFEAESKAEESAFGRTCVFASLDEDSGMGGEQFAEDFSGVAEGGKPSGWHGDALMVVSRENGVCSLQSTAEGARTFAHVEIPWNPRRRDFVFNLDMDRRREVSIVIEGAMHTPDIIASVIGDSNGSGEVRVQLTGTAEKRIRLDTRSEKMRVSLYREGEAIRLLVDNQFAMARGYPGIEEFRGFELWLGGQRSGVIARIHSVSLSTLK